jgi:hypothetical protein
MVQAAMRCRRLAHRALFVPLLSLCALAAFGAAAGCQLPATNPYDPDAPAELRARARLEGSVSGAGGALEGAVVRVGALEVTTGRDGNFSLELPAGQIVLDVSHPAHLRFTLALTLFPGAKEALDVVLDPLPQVPGVDAGRLFGVVHKSGQLSLPAAEQDHSGIVIEVLGTGIRAATSLGGAFDLFLAAGRYDISLATAGHVELILPDLEVVVGTEKEVPGSPFVLQGIPGSVTGLVRLEGGARPDGVAIDLGGGGSAATDANGAFSVGGVPAGRWLLTATHPGYEPFFSFGFVEVLPGRATELPTFEMKLSRGIVSGTALLAGETDHSGVVVQIAGAGNSTTTAEDGGFRIEGVPEGRYTVRLSRDGFVGVNVDGVDVTPDEVTELGEVILARQQGDFTINNGAAFTATRTVALDLEGAGAVEMRISEDAAFTDPARGDVSFRAFDPSPSFTLSPGDGQKVLFAQVKDGDGISGPLLTARITLDETPPIVDVLLINGGAAFTNSQTGIVSLSLSASDATSGVRLMQISNDDVFDEPFEPFAVARTHTLDAPGVDGLKRVFVRVQDFAGNISAPLSAAIELDRLPPVVRVAPRIDCDGNVGPQFCRTPFVTLHVESDDATAMAVSNTAGLPNAVFGPFVVDSAHVLIPGDGVRQVFVLLRDAAGNVTSQLADDVILDSTPPSLASVVIAGGAAAVANERVSLSLAAQGATRMRIAFDGIIDNEPIVPFATTATGDLPLGDGLKSVVVVFLDDAGNFTEARDTVFLDKTPPAAPSVVIDGGAAFTRSVSVTLGLSVTDATEMRIRTDGAFDNEVFVPLAQTAVALLPAGDCVTPGCKQVCAQFRDAAGNLSATACDTITLDSTPPAVPVITTAPGVIGQSAFTLALAGEPADAFFGGYEIVADPGDAGVFAVRQPLAGGGPPAFALTLSGPAATDPALASTTNLIRVRAFDQAGNRSVEATLAVVVDPIAPAVPVPSVSSAFVNADTFAVFFGATNRAGDDANFSHYEIAVVSPTRPVPVFTPTGLQDGLIFTLEQGNDTECSSPCRNLLRVRALDKAGNASGVAEVTVDEDSTFPSQPRLTPRGAIISGTEARMRLAESSIDNGAPATRYEIQGGAIGSFVDVPVGDGIFKLQLDRRDFTHQLCIRGKDAAGNVSTPDCVSVEQRSSIVVAASGIDEETPDIFGDLVTYVDRSAGIVAHELRSGVSQVLDPFGRAARLDGDQDRIVAVWPSDRTKLVSYPVDGLVSRVASTSITAPDSCVKSCAPNVFNVDSVDVGGDDVIIVGADENGVGLFRTTVGACTNEQTPCFEGVAANGIRLTSAARNVALCRGRHDTGVRVHDGVAVWCEVAAGGALQIHRLRLPAGTDETIVTNVQEGRESPHQPIVTSDGIYWASGSDLCRIAATAPVASPLVGCPATHRVLSGAIGQLWGGDEDRVGFTSGTNAFLDPEDATIFDRGSNTVLQLTDDILQQQEVEVWRDRVVYADRERFSNDIVVNELTEGTWLVAEPSIQVGPRTDGRFVVWGDARQGIQLFGLDLLTEREFAITPAAELIAAGDSLFSMANGIVAYGILDIGVGVRLFVQDLATGNQTLIATATNGIRAPELNENASRLVWFDADQGRIKTVALTGITPGPITNFGGAGVSVNRMALSGTTAIFEDNAGGGGSAVRCTQLGSTTNHLVDVSGRGVSAAAVPGLGTFAVWGSNDSIRGCTLSCGATLTCSPRTFARSGGGSVELPVVSASGYVTWTSNQVGDGFGQIAVYDLLADRRFRIATDFGVDGGAPVFDPFIHGQRIVWAGFAFGSADIFTAILDD